MLKNNFLFLIACTLLRQFNILVNKLYVLYKTDVFCMDVFNNVIDRSYKIKYLSEIMKNSNAKKWNERIDI